jgi:hypothetical protein
VAIPRPPRGPRWIFAQTPTYDVVIVLFASVAGLSSAWNFWSQNRLAPALLALAGTVGVLVFSVIKQAVGLAAARKKQSTHELEGCLHTLHAVLAPETCRLRLAIHVPLDGELEQVTEYIGDTTTGKVGRRFPANAGIIGKALRENGAFLAERVNDEYEAYVRELITDWNFTEAQARRVNPGAMTWMAVPLYDQQGRADAILFLDANERDFFTPERQELVLAAVRGIAVFVGKRYTEARTS